MTEAKALKELKKGSEKALAWFIEKYSGYVTTVIYNILGNTMDVSDLEEVASDVFYALWENADKVHSPKGFLGTVARNMAKNKLRQVGNDLPLDDNLIVLEGEDPEQLMEKKECSRLIKSEVLSMGQPDRDIFLRFYYYFQTIEEISAEMGIHPSTVKTKLRRGRMRLHKVLSRYLS